MVTLVVDDEPDVAASHHTGEALVVKGPDRANEDLCIRGGTGSTLLDGNDGLAAERTLDLLAGLREKLLAVREHEHLLPRELREMRKDHRFAGAGRKADDHPSHARA